MGRLLDPSNPEHARADERLREELVIWLTTVRADGQPQSVPVWFHWDGSSFLIYSQPRKPKLANLAANPRVGLHLRGTEAGEDIVIFEGTAEVPADAPPADRVPEYLEKYREQIAGYGWTPQSFASDYSTPLRVTPTVVRIW